MMNRIVLTRTALRGVLFAACAVVSVQPVLAATATGGQSPDAKLPTVHATQAIPAALRPALYSALAEGAGHAFRIGEKGCATLPQSALKACFDSRGAHFSGTHADPLALHLVAWGRDGELNPVKPVRPTFSDNRARYVHGSLAEWWRVLPRGFEQGFTLNKRPAGQGKLILTLAADSQAKQDHHMLSWGKLHYGKLVVTSATGKVIPARLKSVGNRILITVNDVHAAYPLTVDPLVWLEQKAVASDGAANSNFGYSVALSGTTALVGAPWATVKGNSTQGAVYVFSDSSGTWTQTQKLVASGGAAYDLFGWSVAIEGTTALVGSIWATVNGNGSQGAAYVFNESGGSWSQTAKLTASDGTSGDYFGAVALAPSGATALIGAYAADVDGNNGQGAVYVFTQSEGTWSQTQKLTASDGAAANYFGKALAIEGTTALIGAYGATVNGNWAQGAAYVFSDSNGTWTQTQKLTGSAGAAANRFGYSVALEGTAGLIGAPYVAVKGNTIQGTAYVFSESGGTWTQTQQLTASAGAAFDYFGYSVALAGTTALVGTYSSTGNAAYVFDDSNGNWTQTQKLTASDGAAADYFGTAVALGRAALVGAPYAAVNGNAGQGAAYFYGRSDLGLAVSAPDTIGQGQQYVSQTIATNNASAASPAVAVTVTVPAAASFVSANASQGNCSEDSGMVTCDFGQINGNAGTATANVTLKATGGSGTTIENTASVAKATPALMASAATEIASPGGCPADYTEFDGHLDAGESFTSEPIEVTEAGQKYIDLTAPASFGFFAITTTRYGQHTYVYPHAKHGHRWGAAGSYQVGVQAGPDAGGDYTLCVQLNPSQ